MKRFFFSPFIFHVDELDLIFVLGNNVFRLLYLTNFFVDDFEYNLDCQVK